MQTEAVRKAPARASAGSEVVILDERVLDTACNSPPIDKVNVTNSSKFHIGPKFVSVTQNVNNTHVVKGRILGLELISPDNPRRVRCSVAVFVCWTLVVVCALIFVIFQFASAKEQTRLDIGLKEPWYLRRIDWQAVREYSIELLELPVPHVMIGHSAMKRCEDKFDCIKQMMDIQRDHLTRGWEDIGPNFFISASGLLFEGRGANVLGAMVKFWNRNSISVMFLGDYTQNKTTDVQFEHVNVLLAELVKLNVLMPDYTVLTHCQVVGAIYAPGRNVMDNMYHFSHWNSTGKEKCLR